MIVEAWDRYRGWARLARTLQAKDSHNKTIWLFSGMATALFGALATVQPKGTTFGAVLGFLAAASATVAAILGRELLSAGHEARWLRARATAEAIKSECFLAAARVADYAGPVAAERLNRQIAEFDKEALDAGISPLSDPTTNDARRPPEPNSVDFTTDVYRNIRLREQRDYYDKGRRRHETIAGRLRAGSIAAAIAAALLGIAAGTGQAWLAPWIGAVTTAAAAVAAWGMIDRHTYLATSYGAMAYRLLVLDGIASDRTLPALVAETEELLRGEHTAWARRMAKPAAALDVGPGALPHGPAHPLPDKPPAN